MNNISTFFVGGKLCKVAVRSANDCWFPNKNIYHLLEVNGIKVDFHPMLGSNFQWCFDTYISGSYDHEEHFQVKSVGKRKKLVKRAFGITSSLKRKVECLINADYISVESFSVGSGEWSLEVCNEKGDFIFELVGSNGTKCEKDDLYGYLEKLQAIAKRYKSLFNK